MISRLAEYLESEPERVAAKAEAQKAKLEALERKLGIDPSSGTNTPGEPAPAAGKKHRFEDTEYLEQSKELVDGVKNAVSAGMCSFLRVAPVTHNPLALLKKRKKAKLSHDRPTATASTSKTEIEPAAPKAVFVAPAEPSVAVEAIGA